MLLLSLWLTVASAQDEVTLVPAGSQVVTPDETFEVREKSWLLTDPTFREAVAQGKELEIVKPALSDCTNTTVDLTAKIQTVAKQCLTQFDGDQARIDQLVKDYAVMEQRAVTAESRLHEVKVQRAIAWSILGGVVLGSVTALAITLAP